MSSIQTISSSRDSRERTDLRAQYRPIGIGAVAAALAAAPEPRAEPAKAPADESRREESTRIAA